MLLEEKNQRARSDHRTIGQTGRITRNVNKPEISKKRFETGKQRMFYLVRVNREAELPKGSDRMTKELSQKQP